MPFFKRPGPDATPDPELPLTAEQGDRLRGLVRSAFAEAGTEVVVHAGHVEDDSGRQFGLWNLAALCKDAPQRDWPGLVRAHVGRLVNPDEAEDLTDPELEQAVYLRLVESAMLPDPSWHPRATRLGDDLTALLSVDLPESISTPREDFWADRGGLERWWHTGRANLRALLVSDELQHQRLTPPSGEGAFDVVLGESFFTASTALLADDLLRRFAPGTDSSRGVLVTVPFRHQVAFRALDGTPDGVVALNQLFQFAMRGFAEAPGPLSPNVFWVRKGQWRQVTSVVDDQPRAEIDADLAAALGAVRD